MTELIDIRTRQKISTFDKWMKGDHVLVHLDSRCVGVEVPAFLRDEPSLTLKVSYNFQGEVNRDDAGISAYLKFSGNYHRCLLPWTAVWGLTSSEKENALWSEDMPKEVLLRTGHSKLKELGRRLLGKEESDEAAPATPVKPAGAKEKRAPSHLRRIK